MGLLFGAVRLGERVIRGPPHHPMGKHHVRKDYTAPMSQAVSLLIDVCVPFLITRFSLYPVNLCMALIGFWCFDYFSILFKQIQKVLSWYVFDKFFNNFKLCFQQYLTFSKVFLILYKSFSDLFQMIFYNFQVIFLDVFSFN